MILPPLQGKFQQPGFFIYAAADSRYFDLYGRALICSVLTNTDHGVHVHIYDPTSDQLAFCDHPRVSVTWEHLQPGQFDTAEALWSRWDLPEPQRSRKAKMLSLKQFQDNTNLPLWLRKTYYACMRFVRLAEFLPGPQRFLEIDIDGLVRAPFPTVLPNDADHDIYLYEKVKRDKVTGETKSGGHLAGSILFTQHARAWEFVQELGAVIRGCIEADNIYWFLDQVALDSIIPRYRRGLLPQSYIDWHMRPDSAIWTAKGRRKELAVFQTELARYQ